VAPKFLSADSAGRYSFGELQCRPKLYADFASHRRFDAFLRAFNVPYRKFDRIADCDPKCHFRTCSDSWTKRDPFSLA
jgi:hypothetical protein